MVVRNLSNSHQLMLLLKELQDRLDALKGHFVQVVITSSNNKFKYSRYNVVGTNTTSYSATRTLISGTYSGSGFATHLQTKINESGNVIVAYDAVSNKLVFKANETFGQLTIEDSGTTCHSEIGMAAGAGNITVSASSTGDGILDSRHS